MIASAFDLAAIDELTGFVVVQLDVLRRAEGVERGEPLLGLDERIRAACDEHDAHHREHETKAAKPSVHLDALPFSSLYLP